MLNLVDGPCQGTYMCKRAPLFLRAVLDKNGEKDVLDRIEDTAKQSETVHIYRLVGSAGTVHIHGTKVSGWYALGEYHHMPEVDGEALRDNSVWQGWATAQKEKNSLERG